MGACCSKEPSFAEGRVVEDVVEDREYEGNEDDDHVAIGDYGARMRLHGASKYISMYSQQGKKGVNQDAMTVWEEFIGNKDMFFCGVFDGHGPYGHKVARHVRDTLPSRLSAAIKLSQANSIKYGDTDTADGEDSDDSKSEGSKDGENSNSTNNKGTLLLSSWEASFFKCFKDMDEELSLDASIDSFCSGTTAVTVVKQGNHLIIANLGDSRAVLCTRSNKNQLVPVQLTVDLKPNIASEAERIKNRNGRVFAMAEEPEVYRIWMPDEDCPGLAMARAFGDFCLKDYGLISTPEVSYRRLTNKDEFVVLATDGIWDVLSNYDVIRIVASARKRSMAAKMLIKYAVRAWRNKYPGCRVDDCAVICLFLKSRTVLTRSFSEVSRVSANHTELAETYSEVSRASMNCSEIAAVPQRARDHGYETLHAKPYLGSKENTAPDGVNRVNSVVKFPRLRKSSKDFGVVPDT
ncbi:protein phosphatase-2c, putative [Ricinus communis]|uniref:Protein phosphatase-2c, putative n=1 Tax=Ricinus communis TaxID=3988 RepID=B9SL27_RICCO|nr:protein phosphatase-2c, putative [Ricinus communis]|eukprot:XP_002526696.1 probable protein phosphatase 2C 65 [Ricinus communis]